MQSAGDQPVSAPVIVIAGPTGIGKTALALALAARYPAEVVSADSRQIYRYMEIGTAKPTLEERAAVAHHLVDIVEPDQTLTMAEYQARAYAAIGDIHRRGKLPLLVGGTGQYITAVLEGWTAPEVPPNPALRAELEKLAPEVLFERLCSLDPGARNFIDPHNMRRVIRALEVCLETGQPFSAQRGKNPPPYQAFELGLTMEREMLYTRLDGRIDDMMAHGLLNEVNALHARGYDWRLPSMSGLGYAQLGAYIRGEVTLDEAILAIKHDTRVFVRRQYTWFRRHGALRWLEAPALGEVYSLIDAWLGTIITR
jgi:tRNA dimethylallyltransferase